MSAQAEPTDTRPTKGMYRRAAQLFKSKDGEIEIDDNAEVSLGGDPGAYVQCWIWVPDSDVKRAFGE
jgi:hypothetical protein